MLLPDTGSGICECQAGMGLAVRYRTLREIDPGDLSASLDQQRRLSTLIDEEVETIAAITVLVSYKWPKTRCDTNELKSSSKPSILPARELLKAYSSLAFPARQQFKPE
jgi:hypothetical protein